MSKSAVLCLFCLISFCHANPFPGREANEEVPDVGNNEDHVPEVFLVKRSPTQPPSTPSSVGLWPSLFRL